MKQLLAFFAVTFFFVMGYYFSSNSAEFPGYDMKLAQLNNYKSRDPAAIKKVFDFSHLEGSALNTALKQRLISGVKVIRKDTDIGVELGHFVVRGQDGQKEFACQHYSNVVLTFEGVGMTVSGENPKMEVEGKCEISAADINTISPLWIPVSRILGEKVADGDIDYRDSTPKLHFANVSDEWPRMWNLKMIRMYDQSRPGDEIIVSPDEVQSMLKKPFIVEFPQ